MLRHVDSTANIERTPEELLHIGYSVDEINAVIPGYPELDDRLYVAEDVDIPWQRGVILGREVRIFDIPDGPHRATNSSYRAETLTHKTLLADLLHGQPDPDLPANASWRLSPWSNTVSRAIADRCRDFTAHFEPLVPGWRQLLALKTIEGRPIGMPTGIGWYTHYWLSDMSDAVNMRLSEAGDDIEVALYKREADNQSEWVWATAGGYVVKSDTKHPGLSPLQAATIRTSANKTRLNRDVSGYPGVILRTKYPISSGNTLVAGLRTRAVGRFITHPDYQNDPGINNFTEGNARTRQAAGWVSLRDLIASNPEGGVSGKDHGDNLFPIWTTHFEYVVAGLLSVCDPENQRMFGLDDATQARIMSIGEHLQNRHEIVRAA